MKQKARSVSEYLARLDPEKRAALRKLRKDIHSAAPGAEECISYGMPAFRVGGRVQVWFAAMSRHCSFFPGGIVGDYPAALKKYDTSKGTVRFDPAHPLPAALVRKLVRGRIARNAPAAAKKRRARPAVSTSRRSRG